MVVPRPPGRSRPMASATRRQAATTESRRARHADASCSVGHGSNLVGKLRIRRVALQRIETACEHSRVFCCSFRSPPAVAPAGGRQFGRTSKARSASLCKEHPVRRRARRPTSPGRAEHGSGGRLGGRHEAGADDARRSHATREREQALDGDRRCSHRRAASAAPRGPRRALAARSLPVRQAHLVRQLLSHTSGMIDNNDLCGPARLTGSHASAIRRSVPTARLAAALAENRRPGSHHGSRSKLQPICRCSSSRGSGTTTRTSATSSRA